MATHKTLGKSDHGYGDMKVDPVSGAVLAGPLRQVYVYEVPVRIWHWGMIVAMVVLVATGYLIGSPWSGSRQEATYVYFFGNVRMIHFIAGMIFAVLFAMRLYWAVVGNHHARAIFAPPVWSGNWWKGLIGQAGYYLFLRKESALWIGHNPLAQLAMFLMYVLGAIVIILTGFALFAEQYGWGSAWMGAFGWVIDLLGSSQMVRTVHHLAMYYLLIFAIVHMYMATREDIMGGESVIGTMVNGVRTFKTGAKIEKIL